MAGNNHQASRGKGGFRRGSMAEESGRPNSVGLGRRDLEALCEELGSEGDPGVADAQRRHKRRDVRIPRVPIQLRHPGGQVTTLIVACRDLSAGGVGILHNAYLHLDTECMVYLPGRAGKHKRVAGVVRRCRHRRGIVHEVGIEFEDPIDLREVLDLDLGSDWYSVERVEPSELSGSVMYVEGSEVDRRLLRQHLDGTELGVTCVESGDEALARVGPDVDLLIASYHLPDMEGPDLISKLREQGMHAPAILLTIEDSELVRFKCSSCGANAVITKPVDPNLLLRAITEFFATEDLVHHGTASELSPDHPNAQLIPDFLAELGNLAKQLEEGAESGNLEALGTISAQLMGAAPALGFTRIGDQASQLRRAMAREDAGATKSEALKLVGLCRTAETRRAA